MNESSVNQELVRNVVILGGGTAGWMVAAALAKALNGGIRLTVVESDQIGTVGVGEATIPLILRFNEHLGIDEAEFMRETQGVYKLGIEFVDWGRLGHRYMHSFGRFRPDASSVSLEQLWLKLNALGRAPDIGQFRIAEQAALAGKFMRPRDDVPDSPLSDLAYAYHFDASLYAQFLRRYSEARGARRVEGHVVDVELDESGLIKTLKLASGESVAGDFFIDCSGFRGRLIEEVYHAGYEDWTHWLPCDRAVAVPSAGKRPPSPYTRSTALTAGWQWRIPLQHRTGNGYVFSSRHISEDEATATLLANLDTEPLTEPRTLRFVTGMRRKSWYRNCVAIGLSSGFLEPLESTGIHLIQSAIGRLIDFFPSREFTDADIDEYNRQTRREYEQARDFVILHYHLMDRTDSPFWNYCRTMPIPESLRRRIDLFRGHGRIVREDQELFAEGSWLQVFLGQGLRPRGYQPLVDLADTEAIARYLEQLRGTIDKCVEFMPTHDAFIKEHCDATRATSGLV